MSRLSMGEKMIKASDWKGNDLKGEYIFSVKIDGVRMLRDSEGNPVSRNNKPLYNLESVPKEITDCEIFYKSWEDTISIVRSKAKKELPEGSVYSLDPLDKRLYIQTIDNPTKEIIQDYLKVFVKFGEEGLVLRSKDKWIKVKPKYTEDVPILGYVEGQGRLLGKVGSVITSLGNVGTGLKDKERTKEFLPIGTVIEVEYMEKTPAGKFRHPRFIRKRFDK